MLVILKFLFSLVLNQKNRMKAVCVDSPVSWQYTDNFGGIQFSHLFRFFLIILNLDDKLASNRAFFFNYKLLFFTARQFKLMMEPLCDNLRRVNIAEVPTQVEGREEPRQAEEVSSSNIQGEVILKLMRHVYIKWF